MLEEARCGRKVGRAATDRLEERRVRNRVVELDRADPTCQGRAGTVSDSKTVPSKQDDSHPGLTEVVVPPRELVVLRGRLRELGLADEAVRLVVQAVVEVVAE